MSAIAQFFPDTYSRLRIDSLAYRVGKRSIDIAASIAVLIAMVPVLALIAMAVSSSGPVLYRQERVGRHGRTFGMLKFRTMRASPDHESRWTAARDERVTRVGRILRATSLDELPQFLNVLKGDMSIVGPRPERPHFVRQFSIDMPMYAARHAGHVGITGLAQVEGFRGDTSIADRIAKDVHYLEHWSLLSDLKIMARTIPVMVKHSAY